MPTEKDNNKFIYLSIKSLVQSCGLNRTLPTAGSPKVKRHSSAKPWHVPGTTSIQCSWRKKTEVERERKWWEVR